MHGAGLARRRLLQGMVVAPAIWVAPQIISAPAAAAQTCVDSTLSWDLEFPGSPLGSPVPLTNGVSRTVGGTTMTYTWVDTSPTSVQFHEVNGTFQRLALGAPRVPQFQLNGSGPGPVVHRFTFDQPVLNVAFDVLDVDQNGSSWRDEIDVFGELGATTPIIGVGTLRGNAGEVSAIVPNRTYRGNVLIPNPNDDRSDVGFFFAGPVDRIVLRHVRAGGGNSQGVGISNISWCV
ncbi:MAG: hypothetical protein JJU45_00525 [Acidimicrobiia bacterium]|nr:hypothetical protein [Acidimicrobiia bacterium]